MIDTYRVVITGIKDGISSQPVMEKLATLLKVPEREIRTQLQAAYFIVKNGVDAQVAKKIQASLEQIGCKCIIEIVEVTNDTSNSINSDFQENNFELIYCNNCGGLSNATSKFCSQCGYNLSNDISCYNCGRILKPMARYCEDCGASLVSKSGNTKSFGNYLLNIAWYWVPISLISALLIVAGSIPYISAIIIGVWLIYNHFVWTAWAKKPEIFPQATQQSWKIGRLFIAITVSILLSYIISHEGPDHHSYFHDLPYEAAIEEGYSPHEAENMIPTIIQLATYPHGLFLTASGWCWFLILSIVYSWRGYKLLVPTKFQHIETEKDEQQRNNTQTESQSDLESTDRFEKSYDDPIRNIWSVKVIFILAFVFVLTMFILFGIIGLVGAAIVSVVVYLALVKAKNK